MLEKNYLIFCAEILGFEQAIWEWGKNYPRGRFVHSSIGHELGAFSVTRVLQAAQARWCLYYRSHAWNLALDCDLEGIVTAITGSLDRRTSSMHLMLRPEIIDCNSIVAAQFPIAVGAALTDRSIPVVCVAGDGATNTGAFFESVNVAVKHSLPVLFVIEDNGIQIGTPYETTSAQTIPSKCSALGLSVQSIDCKKQNLADIISIVNCQVGALELGPSMLHINCVRPGGHMVSADTAPQISDEIAADIQALSAYQSTLRRTRLLCAEMHQEALQQ